MADTDQHTMQDPTTQYPQPEFPAQTQSEPGLAKEMNPRPRITARTVIRAAAVLKAVRRW